MDIDIKVDCAKHQLKLESKYWNLSQQFNALMYKCIYLYDINWEQERLEGREPFSSTFISLAEFL